MELPLRRWHSLKLVPPRVRRHHPLASLPASSSPAVNHSCMT